MKETHKRSIMKAISWRLIATTITSLIAYYVFGSTEGALKVGAADLVLKLMSYYLHERAWLKIQYGQLKGADYEI